MWVLRAAKDRCQQGKFTITLEKIMIIFDYEGCLSIYMFMDSVRPRTSTAGKLQSTTAITKGMRAKKRNQSLVLGDPNDKMIMRVFRPYHRRDPHCEEL